MSAMAIRKSFDEEPSNAAFGLSRRSRSRPSSVATTPLSLDWLVTVAVVETGGYSCRGALMDGHPWAHPAPDVAIRGEMPTHRRRSRIRGPVAWSASVTLLKFSGTIIRCNVRGPMLYCHIVQSEA